MSEIIPPGIPVISVVTGYFEETLLTIPTETFQGFFHYKLLQSILEIILAINLRKHYIVSFVFLLNLMHRFFSKYLQDSFQKVLHKLLLFCINEYFN